MPKRYAKPYCTTAARYAPFITNPKDSLNMHHTTKRYERSFKTPEPSHTMRPLAPKPVKYNNCDYKGKSTYSERLPHLILPPLFRIIKQRLTKVRLSLLAQATRIAKVIGPASNAVTMSICVDVRGRRLGTGRVLRITTVGSAVVFVVLVFLVVVLDIDW